MSERLTLFVAGQYGRDAGKSFHIQEISPLILSGYVLRLVAALRVDSFEELLSEFSNESGSPIDAIMRLLRGADPQAVHALITELVEKYVRVAPDPQHPGAVRELMVTDIQELRTLGTLLVGIAKMHFQYEG